MANKMAGWLTLAAGIALMAIYSAVMMASEGDAAWAWLLLLAGVVLLVIGGRRAATSDDESPDA